MAFCSQCRSTWWCVLITKRVLFGCSSRNRIKIIYEIVIICNPIRCSNKEAPNIAYEQRTRLFVYTVFFPVGSTKLNYYIWFFLPRIDGGKFNRTCGFGFYRQWRVHGDGHDVRSTNTQSFAVESAVQIDLFGSHQMEFDCRIETKINN